MLVIQITDSNPDLEVAMQLARHFASPASRGTLLWILSASVLAAQTPASSDDAAALAASRARLAAETYVAPPQEIVKLVTAPRHLNVSLTRQSPDRRHFLREESAGLPSVTSFGKLHHYFGGLQVDPAANRARSLTTRGAAGLSLIDAVTGKVTAVELPAGATASGAVWSPDGSRIAYIANFETASHVYVAEVATGKSRVLTRTPLLATLVTSIDWTAGGSSIIAVLIPDNRGPEPVRPPVAAGPRVQLWMDSLKSPQRMYASLLEEPYDRSLMEYYVTGQLTAIDVRTRAARRIGAPAMISSVEPSPDGQYLRVRTMQKPFSYIVQYGNFGELEQIWDAGGRVLAEVARRPLRESPDTSDTPQARRDDGGKRALAWMPRGGGLYYLDAIGSRSRGADSADAGTASGAGRPGGATRPDKVVRWMPPFGPGDTTVIHRAEGPISQIAWSEDQTTLFVGISRNGSGEIYAVRPGSPEKKFTIVRQRGYTPAIGAVSAGFGGGRGGTASDSLSFYTNPGWLMTRNAGTGVVAMVSSDSSVYLAGVQYNRNYLENPPRAFVDKVVIATGAKSRVFESAADLAETVVAPLDDDFARAIVLRESATQPPNSFLRDMKTGALVQLTANVDRTPDFTALTRKRVTVTRADGIKFIVRVTLPAGYQAGTRLPGMFWFYPYEYTDQRGYDRTLRNENVNRFPESGTRTIEYLATQGYAVANFNPPIIGDAGRMNDNYVSDLRMNLLAVIDELDRQGMIDRQRLGVGGHSYGAFSTANALVHTPFFKAGIAGDGMYNRTLTPTGFQSERRDLWSGQKTYLDMSPMLYADKMQGALLMYHGLEDQNVGTNPISSIRMMQALRSEGKTASLFLYPYEDHGPATKETLLDLWGRWTAWLDIYVKHAGAKSKSNVTSMRQ